MRHHTTKAPVAVTAQGILWIFSTRKVQEAGVERECVARFRGRASGGSAIIAPIGTAPLGIATTIVSL